MDFILIKRKENDINLTQILLFLHFLNYYKTHVRPVWIGYTFTPVYAKFKNDWCKKIGRWYYAVLFILPLVLFLKLVLMYQHTVLWWIKLAVLVPWFVYTLFFFISDCVYKARVEAHNRSIKTGKHIRMRFGMPGSGKTSSEIYDDKLLADVQWNLICEEYKMLEPYLDTIPFWSQRKRERAEEVIEAYHYYQESGTYPCFWTSIPVFVDDVPANRLTAKHLLQEDRLPYRPSAVIDESNLVLPPELHRTNPEAVLEMGKFPRHYGDMHFGLTDQAKEGAFIGWRRCTSETMFMTGQKWVCKPRFLIWLKTFLLNHKQERGKTFVNFIRVLNKIINHIGYRKYSYILFGNEYIETRSKEKSFVLPCFLNCDYDDRAFRKGYRCINEPLKVSKWDSMEFSKQQIDEIFSKQIREMTKSQKQKNKATRKKKKEQEEFGEEL